MFHATGINLSSILSPKRTAEEHSVLSKAIITIVKKKVHLLKSERQGVDHRGLRKQNTGECWYHIDELKETLKKREDKNIYCMANNIMITPHSWCLKSIELGHLEVLWKVTVTVISWRKKLFNSGFARF